MSPLPKDWEKKALSGLARYGRFLKRAGVRETLPRLEELHEEAFSRIDCLECAACCKNYSPRFKTPDIRRISKALGLKEGSFIEKYLLLDEEGDYVVNQKPCPFLQSDNRCGIYEIRPSDCSRFPYTDEDVLLKRPTLTLKNVTFCPAVFHVMEQLTAEPGSAKDSNSKRSEK
jgi:hypothetical protein